MNRYFTVFFLLLFASIANAQSYDVAGGSYRAMREIDAPARAKVIVTQFMHQGLINLSAKNADPRMENTGKSVLVTTKTKKPVPFRILQLGPGDYCRIAIQNEERASGYVIYYGIPTAGTPNRNVQVPAWTNDSGLLFEARRVDSAFDMDNVESLKRAFEKARPIGADYVKAVYHGYNPLTLRREPFMSRYTGFLNVTTPGKYAIVTSSHHCSFLLLDDKEVASHPGRHGRAWQARPELVKNVNLTQGRHKFEYYHATGDETTSMLVVWAFNPGEKPKYEIIPEEAFTSADIARINSGAVQFADQPGSPDFEYRVVGSVPLPDNEQQMIAVQFQNKSAGLAARGKLRWKFGDGQESEETSPMHVYLKPGIYTVELTSDSASQHLAALNKIEIDQPHQAQDPKNLPTLDQYLAVLEKYDASKLDAEALLQLIEVYQAKIDTFLNPTAEELEAAEKAMIEGTPEPGQGPKPRTAQRQPVRPARELTPQEKAKLEQVTKFRRLMAETVRTALVDNPNFKGDTAVYQLALQTGTIARDYLLDWKLAGQIYVAAAKKLTLNDYAAECYALAADVSLDMRNKTAAKGFLDQAEKKLSKLGTGQSISTYYRVLGEFLAEDGKAEEARKALEKATSTSGGRILYAERVALQGSASRNAEKFLQERNYDRVIESLRTWQLEYPAAAFEGFITLLFAKYWIGREQYELAASLADRQLTLNPDSPYIDELLLTASEAQEKAGNKDAAKAYLNSLLKDYPGSALIPDAKERLGKLQ